MAGEIEFQSDSLECAADLYLLSCAKHFATGAGRERSPLQSMLTSPAQALADLGFMVIAIDYRSFDNSGGRMHGDSSSLNEADNCRSAVREMASRCAVRADLVEGWRVNFDRAVNERHMTVLD